MARYDDHREVQRAGVAGTRRRREPVVDAVAHEQRAREQRARLRHEHERRDDDRAALRPQHAEQAGA